MRNIHPAQAHILKVQKNKNSQIWEQLERECMWQCQNVVSEANFATATEDERRTLAAF